MSFIWADMGTDRLSWGQGLLGFQHHSYTPFKDRNGGPNTWH
jgi:hypothetical protein